MRLRNHVFLAALFLVGCGSADSTDLGTPPQGTGGSGGLFGPPSPPLRLSDDAVALIGTTNDGQVVYRNSTALVAIKLDGSESKPRVISEKGGSVQIRGNIVFLFSDVDWTTNLGELTVWTAQTGAKSAGIVMYGEDTALATPDGSWIAYMNNVQERTADLVVATPDLATQKVLIPGVGRGAEDTCRAVYGFVQNRVFAAWCPPGTRDAKLERFDAPDWVPMALAPKANTLWSTDISGDRVFYTDPSSGAWYLEGGNATKIDAGVGWGTLLPDGSAVLYTVSDQLRRTAVPSVAPTPVVATKFTARAAWSPSYGHSLYSSVVTYEHGTRRDLWLTRTDAFNPEPIELMGEPKAEISRSAFSSDGKWVMYLTDTDNDQKTLVVRSVDGGEPITIHHVDTVVAAHGSRILYSANRSDPEKYPIKADLMLMDPSSSQEPVLMQSGTTDGRGFYLSSDNKQLVFVMPQVETTPSGVYVQDVP